MVILFLLLVGNINCNKVCVLGIVGFLQLLLVIALRFCLIERRLSLLPLAFEFLASLVIFSLGLLQSSIRGVSFDLEVIGVLDMSLAQLLKLGSLLLI